MQLLSNVTDHLVMAVRYLDKSCGVQGVKSNRVICRNDEKRILNTKCIISVNILTNHDGTRGDGIVGIIRIQNENVALVQLSLGYGLIIEGA